MPVTDMTAGPVLRTVVAFGIPMTAANLVQQSYLLVDSAVVGRYVGVTGLAAIGASQPLFYLFQAIFIGIAAGFSIRLAQMKGGGRADRAGTAAAALAACCVAWALACVLLVGWGAGHLFDLMGVHGAVARDGESFLRTLSIGFVPTFGVGAISAYLRGLGDSRTPMVILAISSLLNLLLVWLFVGPLGLGMRGAALATVVTNVVACLAGVLYVRTAQRSGRPPVRWRAVGDETRVSLRLGLPVAAQHVLLAVGTMVLIGIVTPLGTSILAAVTVVSRLEMFASMVFIDLGGALTIFVAQNRAAGRRDRADRGLRDSLRVTGVLTALVSAVVLLCASWLAGAVTGDQTAHDAITRYIYLTYPFFFLYTVMVIMHGYLNGSGRTVLPTACTALSFAVVRLPLSYLLRGPYGIDGLIWPVVIGWLVGFLYTALVTHRMEPLSERAIPSHSTTGGTSC